MAETELERVTARYTAAFNGRDWAAMRDVLADGLVVEEFRPGRGFPEMHGRDSFVERAKVSFEIVPDRRMGPLAWIVRHASAGVAHIEFRGHSAIGGGEVVTDRIAMLFTANDQYSRLAFFESDDESGAVAYFESLSG